MMCLYVGVVWNKQILIAEWAALFCKRNYKLVTKEIKEKGGGHPKKNKDLKEM